MKLGECALLVMMITSSIWAIILGVLSHRHARQLRALRGAKTLAIVYVVAQLPDSGVEEYSAIDGWVRDVKDPALNLWRNATAAQMRAEQAKGAYVLPCRIDQRSRIS